MTTTRPVALVGGGSGAIGAAVCAALARDGFDVALTYHSNRGAAEDAATAVAAAGGTASTHQLELGDADEVASVVAGFASLDAVIYAAGPYIPMRYIGAIEPSVFASQLAHDAVACFNLLHAALPALEDSSGSVVAVSTPAVRRYASRDVLSAAPKAAVEQVVRGVAAEYGKYGVRANCVGVGFLEEGLYDDLLASGDYNDRVLEIARRGIALRRFGRAADVAEAVAFLVSPRASWITGQTLDVDGGYSL